MPKYASNRIELDVGFNVDKSNLQKVRQAFKQIQNIKPGQFNGSEAELRRIQAEAKKVETALQNAFNVKLGTVNLQSFQKELKKADTSISQVYADLSKLGGVGQASFARMASSIMSTNLQLKQTHSLMQSFGNTMVNTIKWGFASSIINGFTSSVQQAVSYVEGLDKSLTNIRIVTGDSRQEMAQFANEANRAAQQLGRSTMDYTKAALSYYQQGLSDEEVAARTEATLKAQNITGAGDEMADYLTAVWNGYRVANEEAELYVDKLAAVADSSASNMAQLATAMSKVASTADMMGVPVDSLNAQIATIVATTRQAPESVGNALKTIYTRIADIKAGSDDAQISLGNYSSKMKEVGINVLDSEGHFRDLGDIIEQIGGKWSGMSKEQQIYLARTMAGQRQINNLLALFNNWDKYSNLVTTSMESQGTTMEKNSRYMESLGAHLEQLGAAQQRFKSSMIDSDSFKGLVDIGTGFTKLGAQLVEAIGGGGNALLTLGSIATQVFSGIISREIGAAIINQQTFKNNLQEIARVEQEVAAGSQSALNQGLAEKYLADLRNMTAAWRGLSNEQKMTQKNRADELNDLRAEEVILKEQLQIADKLAIALTGKTTGQARQTTGIKHLTNQFEDLQNKINIANQAFKNFGISGDQGADAAKTALADLVPTLNEVVQKMGTAATQNDRNTVKVLQGIVSQGRYTANQEELVISLIEKLINRAETAGFALKEALGINTTPTQQRLNQLSQRIRQLGQEFREVNEQGIQLNKIQSFVKMASGIGQLTAGINGVVSAFKALGNESLSGGEKALQFISGLTMSIGMLASGFKSITPLVATFITKLVAGMEASTAATFVQTAANEGLFASIKAVNAETEKTITLMAILKGLMNPIFLGIAATITGLVILGKSLYDQWNADANAAKKAAQTANEVREAYDNVKQSADQLKSSLEEYRILQDSFKDLTVGTEEWNEALKESNQLVLDLIQQFPELAKYVSNVDGKLVLDEEGLKEYQATIDEQVNRMGAANDSAQSQARRASIQSDATDLSRRYNNSNFTSWTSDDIKQIATALGDFQAGNRSENNLTQLAKNLGEQLNLPETKFLEELLNDPALSQLTAAIQADTAATEVATEARVMASEDFTESAEYLAASNEERSVMENLAAKSLQNTTNTLTKTFTDALTSDLNKLSDVKNATQIGGTDLSGNDLLSAAKEYFSDQALSWAANSVRGSDKNREFAFTDSQGEERTISAQAMASILATSKALDELGNSAQQTKQVLNNLANESEDNNKAMLEFLQGEGLGGLTKKQLQGINVEDLSSFFAKYYNQAGYKSAEEFKSAFVNDLTQTENLFNLANLDLSPIVQRTFQNLSKNAFGDDLTANATKSISESLQKAFNQGGEEGLETLSDFYANISDNNKLEQLAETFDFENATVGSFREALTEAGIATSATNEQIQAYIDAQRDAAAATSENIEEQYKKVNDIASKLKTGDIIDSQQASVLEQAGVQLDRYFEKYADGSYKLTEDANVFYSQINALSLEPFRAELEKLDAQLNQARDFQNSEFARNPQASDSANDYVFNNFSSSAEGEDKVRLAEKQIQFVQTLNGLEEDEKRIIQESNSLLERKGFLSNTEAQALAKVVNEHRNEWDNYNQEIDSMMQRSAELNEEIQNSSRLPLDADVDQDQWKTLTEYYKDNAKALEGVDEAVQDNQRSAEDLAEAMLRYDSALEAVNEHYSDWEDALTSGSITDQIQAGEQLQNVYSDLLDLPFESLSPKFTQDIENLQLLKQAAQGSEQAYASLQQKAAQDILMHGEIDFDTDAAAAKVDEDLDYIRSTVQSFTGQDFGDLEIGAELNDANFLNGLTDMVNAAGLSASQATDYLASMGIDAEVVENTDEVQDEREYQSNLVPHINSQWVEVPIINNVAAGMGQASTRVMFPSVVYESQTQTENETKTFTAPTLKVKSAKKSSGGGFKHSNAKRSSGGGNKGGGGGKKGGGSGSSPKKQTMNVSTQKIDKATKTAEKNPYEEVEKSYKRQEKALKALQNQQKNLNGKDRLENLKKQTEELKEQNDIIAERARISKKNTENSTTGIRKKLQKQFGDIAQFDSDGEIASVENLEQAAADQYNKRMNSAYKEYKNIEKAAKDFEKKYNKMSPEEQKANKARREELQKNLKNAKTNYDEEKKLAEDAYKKKTELIKKYQDALEEDRKYFETYCDNIRKELELNFEELTLKLDLKLDAGDFEREYLDWQNKVIKRIKDDDFSGQASAAIGKIKTYLDTGEIKASFDQINELKKDIETLKNGNWIESDLYDEEEFNKLAKGITDPKQLEKIREDLRLSTLKDYEDRLKQVLKESMDRYEDIYDTVQEIHDIYLDAMDAGKDKLDQNIDKYERINSLIDHNVKMTNMLYGDKAYATLDRYYELQRQNNAKELSDLQGQRAYWAQQMANAAVGSDEWKKAKQFMEDAVDNMNSKLEQMVQNLGTQLENRLSAAVDKVNKKMTGGLGIDYLDEQWDYINNYDDYFLDTVQSKLGIDDVTRAYESAMQDTMGNPKQQKRINDLMNNQLKILKEKDKLTQYDLDRAKALLEIEKDRMALEDARNNKTKMRLRRDSQGNYTYQYVADEEKLTDLQQALADAQSDLYNQDKEHYKQNLNQLYDTYKEYLEKRAELEKQYNATQDQAEKDRIEARIKLLNQSANQMMKSLTQDNDYNFAYIAQSTFAALNIDPTLYSTEEQIEFIKNNVPQAGAQIQNLADRIKGEGGLLNSVSEGLEEMAAATQEYTNQLKETLALTGTTVEAIGQAWDKNGNALDKNIQLTKQYIATNKELISSIDNELKSIQFELQVAEQMMEELNPGQIERAINKGVGFYQSKVNDYNNTPTTTFLSSNAAKSADQVVDNQLKSNYNFDKNLTNAIVNNMDTSNMLNNKTYNDFIKQQTQSILSFVNNIPKALVQNMTKGKAIDELDTVLSYSANSIQKTIADRAASSIPLENQAEELSKIAMQALVKGLQDNDIINSTYYVTNSFPNAKDAQEIINAFINWSNTMSQQVSILNG